MVLVRSLAVFLEKFEVVAAYKVQDEGLAALACGPTLEGVFTLGKGLVEDEDQTALGRR